MRLEDVGGGGRWPSDRWQRGGVVRRWECRLSHGRQGGDGDTGVRLRS
jgi:hypothetical protein